MRILMSVVLALSLWGTAAMAAPTIPAKTIQAAAPAATATAKPAATPQKAGATATRCRDAKGHFMACGTTAKKQTCRDTKGRFASCKS
ncbi:hypothetical protein [Thermomonas sp.]|uniref:hypothetical protein n=1 Tax=Thermomonas sp. TaxID=1971895 RepID=UPI00248A6773|nr:hypothetical protein [Thermomonas sp.]MDI1251745.1 hypothetical protein [Thermomonas sp.]